MPMIDTAHTIEVDGVRWREMTIGEVWAHRASRRTNLWGRPVAIIRGTYYMQESPSIVPEERRRTSRNKFNEGGFNPTITERRDEVRRETV